MAQGHNIHEKAGVQNVHYNKADLLKDYQATFRVFVTGLMLAVVVAVLYFFSLAVYLGGWGHSKAEPFVEQFNERAPVDYKGLKLPAFGGPAKPEPAHHAEPAAPATPQGGH